MKHLLHRRTKTFLQEDPSPETSGSSAFPTPLRKEINLERIGEIVKKTRCGLEAQESHTSPFSKVATCFSSAICTKITQN
jgi:hypothetical protein